MGGGLALAGEDCGYPSYCAGAAVASPGDVNGDGLDDVIIGSPGFDTDAGNSAGRTYVVLGTANVDPVALGDVASGIGGFAIDGAWGTLLTGLDEVGDGSGRGLHAAGDMNGDGLADLAIGSSNHKGYVVFGKADNANVWLGDVEAGVGGFFLDGVGGSAGGGGDIDGDGVPDVIFGAATPHPTWVAYGKADTAAVSVDDIGWGGTAGFTISRESFQRARGGTSIGDVDGDGYADIVIGAPLADPQGDASGKAYVVFGGNFTGAVLP
jgi:hypothetical protein